MSNQLTPHKKIDLPAFEDLLKDPEEAFKNDQFNALVNQEPPVKWLKPHPTAKNRKGEPIKYITIEKVEFLLTKIFGDWHPEVIEYKQLFNAVSCHVRLHVTNPFTGEKAFYDGVGAVSVQVDKGESAADLSKIKSNAVQLALPAAKSYAIKDAAEHIGKLFGRDISREDTVLSDVYQKQAAKWGTTEEQRLIEKINACKTLEELATLQENNPNFDITIFEPRKEQLRNETEL